MSATTSKDLSKWSKNSKNDEFQKKAIQIDAIIFFTKKRWLKSVCQSSASMDKLRISKTYYTKYSKLKWKLFYLHHCITRHWKSSDNNGYMMVMTQLNRNLAVFFRFLWLCLLHDMNLIWILNRRVIEFFFLVIFWNCKVIVSVGKWLLFFVCQTQKNCPFKFQLHISSVLVLLANASNNWTKRKNERNCCGNNKTNTKKQKHALTIDDSKIRSRARAHTPPVRKVWSKNVRWICN